MNAMIPYRAERLEEQLALAREYIVNFRLWAMTRSNVKSVIMADDEDKRRGIDMWIKLMEREKAIPIKVVIDFRQYFERSMSVETIDHLTYHDEWQPGWFSRLNSSILLVHCCSETGWFNIFKSQEFFRRIMRNYLDYRPYQKIVGSQDGGSFWYTTGVLVPTDDVKDIVIARGNLLNTKSGNKQIVM